jgi:hypothetical protein
MLLSKQYYSLYGICAKSEGESCGGYAYHVS